MNIQQLRWQPVVLVIEGHRVECECGNLATFVTGKMSEDGKYNVLDNVDCWCQVCFGRAQEQRLEEAS